MNRQCLWKKTLIQKKWLIDINFRHSIVSLPSNQDSQSSYLIYSNWVKSVRIRSCSGPHFSRIFRHSDWIRRLRSVCLQYFWQIYSLIGNKIEESIFTVVDFFYFSSFSFKENHFLVEDDNPSEKYCDSQGRTRWYWYRWYSENLEVFSLIVESLLEILTKRKREVFVMPQSEIIARICNTWPNL